MFFVGLFAGALVISLANLIGIAGWVFGLGFAVVLLAIVYLDQKLMNFEMKYVIRLIAQVAKVDMDQIKDEEAKEKQVPRTDYFAFAAGVIVGLSASLIWSPTTITGLLPFSFS
jgi:hypothetical protein